TADDEVCINPGGGVTVTRNGAATVAALTLGSGRLHSTADLAVTGALTWTGGTQSGAGRTAAAGMEIGGNANKFLEDNRVLENAGAAVWTGNGEIIVGSGASLHNAPGATFDARTDSFIARGSSSPPPSFLNEGTFVKSAGTAESGIEIPFTNS